MLYLSSYLISFRILLAFIMTHLFGNMAANLQHSSPETPGEAGQPASISTADGDSQLSGQDKAHLCPNKLAGYA